MQLFVKDMNYGKTHVYHCTPQSTVEDLLQWIEDTIGAPKNRVWLYTNSRYVPMYPVDVRTRTLPSVNVSSEQTIYVRPRFSA